MEDDIQSLPIDIHIGKLVGWLVSRQHSSKDWAENAREVREKINAAIQDMPEHPEIVKLLSGSYINYFHCLKIVEILKETEADSKNILGWYTSQRMKDWQAIVKSYEKGGAGLAESGQLLHQYIAYEIPGLYNQIQRCVQIQEECNRKEENVHKTAKNFHNQYLKQCKQMSIEGHDVRDEIFGLLKDMPKELDDTGKRFCDLKSAVQFYLDFISFTCDKEKFQNSLLMLRYVIEHGNVTTYEYIHSEAPLSVEDPISALIESNKCESQKDEEVAEGIDFGDDGGAIDFGDGGEAIDFGDGGEIDFGDGEESGDIDWGAADEAVAGITLEESGVEGGVARGVEALSLLLNNTMRNKIVDDLYELEGFLQQRIDEMNASDHSSSTLNLWEDAPKSLQMVSVKQTSEQLQNVRSIIDSLSTLKMVQLFLISDSPRYVDRLCESLLNKKKKSELNQPLIDSIWQKKEESVKQEKSLYRQLEQIKKSSKVLCPQIQNAISLKYKNRPVNIMGVSKNL